MKPTDAGRRRPSPLIRAAATGYVVIALNRVKVARTRLPSVGSRSLFPVLGSQPAGDVSHKLGGRLPLLSARAVVTLATLKRAATNFTA